MDSTVDYMAQLKLIIKLPLSISHCVTYYHISPSGISKDMREVVMSPDQDDFLKDTLYSDFGEIGMKIKNLVDQFQHKQKSTAQINSISDMKK